MLKPLVMTKPPLHFSIVTITFNNQHGLIKTAESIKRQSYLDYEWVIIDGGSNAIIPEDIPSDKVMLNSESDTGIYDAMNKGIDLANGDYIIFMNAGDQFADENTLSIISQSNVDFIYGDSLEEKGNNTHYKTARNANAIALGMFTHHQAMVYKASLIEELRYNETYKIAADYDFTYRFLNKATTTKYIKKPLCIFESGGVSQTNVRHGRVEQFKIRQTMKYFILKNIFIFSGQTMVYRFRQACPKLYWFLKRGSQADNI